MLHVNKDATAYALPHHWNAESAPAAERAVLCFRYAGERPTTDASYAHEILHLFGAGDQYFPYDKTDDRLKLAQRLWPNEIMLRPDKIWDCAGRRPLTEENPSAEDPEPAEEDQGLAPL